MSDQLFHQMSNFMTRKMRYGQEILQATVTADNGDGTYDVVLKGNSGAMKRVPFVGQGTLRVNDTVMIANYDGDRQRPQIVVGAGAQSTPNPLTFDLAGGLDWLTNFSPTNLSHGVHRSVQQVNSFNLANSVMLAFQNNSYVLASSILPASFIFQDSGAQNMALYKPNFAAGPSMDQNPAFTFTQPSGFGPFASLTDSTGIYYGTQDSSGNLVVEKISLADGSTVWTATIPTPLGYFSTLTMAKTGKQLACYITWHNTYSESPARTLPIQFPVYITPDGGQPGSVFFEAGVASIDTSNGSYVFNQVSLLHGDNAQDVYNDHLENRIGYNAASIYQTVWQFDLTGWYVCLDPVKNQLPSSNFFFRTLQWYSLGKDFPFSTPTTLSSQVKNNQSAAHPFPAGRKAVIFSPDSDHDFAFFSDLYYDDNPAHWADPNMYGLLQNSVSSVAPTPLIAQRSDFTDISGPTSAASWWMDCLLMPVVPVGQWRLVQISADIASGSITQTTLLTITEDASHNPVCPSGIMLLPWADFFSGFFPPDNTYGPGFHTSGRTWDQFDTSQQAGLGSAQSAYENRVNQSANSFFVPSFIPVNGTSVTYPSGGGGTIPSGGPSRLTLFHFGSIWQNFVLSPNNANLVYNSNAPSNINSTDFCGPGLMIDISGRQAISLADLNTVLWVQNSVFWNWVCWMTDDLVCVCNFSTLYILSAKSGAILFQKGYSSLSIFNNGNIGNGGGEASIIGGDGSFVVASQQNSTEILLEHYK